MKKALTKKAASEVKDVAESKWWLEDEELNQLIAEIHSNNQTEAIRTLAAKFGAVDGVGEALSLVTAAVAVTVSECARRATTCLLLKTTAAGAHVIEHASGHHG